MANLLMMIGLIGTVIGIIAPVFRVLNKKPRRSKGWAIVAVLSFVVFILGVLLGLK